MKNHDYQRNDMVEVNGATGIVEGYNKKNKLVVLLVHDGTRVAVNEQDVLPNVRKQRETAD